MRTVQGPKSIKVDGGEKSRGKSGKPAGTLRPCHGRGLAPNVIGRPTRYPPQGIASGLEMGNRLCNR
jgi:hypothetical protein